MKKLITLTLLLTLVFTLTTCESTSRTVAKNGTASRSGGIPYKGDGGKGKRLAILVPEGKNLTAAETYLTTLVQSGFVSDFSKFSAMSVLDRQNLEKILKETESGIYKSEADFGQLGEIANVGYALTGAITKTSSGFALQMQITDTKTFETKAYSGSCTARELEDFTGVKKASLDLLTQMGVELTDKGREELTGISTEQTISAETALAKGITAQKGGTTIEALAYYYQAASFDPSLKEATGRASVISANISNGNIGDNARNKIAAYKNDLAYKNAWQQILTECNEFLKDHIPFEIVVNQKLKQKGDIDYKNETITLEGSVTIKPTNGFDIIRDVLKGLNKTGRKEAWGFDKWPCTNDSPFGLEFFKRANFYGRWYNITYPIRIHLFLYNGEDIFFISSCLVDVSCIAGKFYDREYDEHKKALRVEPKIGTFNVLFTDVKVDDITDKMTIEVGFVNGIDVETAGRNGYVKITTGK